MVTLALTCVHANMSVPYCGCLDHAGLALRKCCGLDIGIEGVLRTGTAAMRPRTVLVRSCLAIRACMVVTHLQHAFRAGSTFNTSLLVCIAIFYTSPRIAPWTCHELVNGPLHYPRRVDHHRHHHVVASANQSGRTILTEIGIGINDVLL